MPIYTYECLSCGKKEDKLVKREDVDHLQFCTCRPELSMRKIDSFGASVLNFKGRWFKTTGGY
jgi:putative FmdB family regulatory protein